MRLLILGPDADDVTRLHNFTGIWSHFLAKEFRAAGVELQFDKQRKVTSSPDSVRHYKELDLTGVDHVLAFGLGYLDRLPPECVIDLKGRCRGLVAQTHDRPPNKSLVSVTFGIRQPKPGTERYVPIGWAADPELCKPTQAADRTTILIDHPDYVGNRLKLDMTRRITDQALLFARRRRVEVRRIGNNGIANCFSGMPPRYNREHIPYVDMCREYGKADVFCVTHPESVGLTALECAMAGALVVAPMGYIGADLIKTIRHVCFTRDVPWERVLRMRDIAASREAAMANTWAGVASRILKGLTC